MNQKPEQRKGTPALLLLILGLLLLLAVPPMLRRQQQATTSPPGKQNGSTGPAQPDAADARPFGALGNPRQGIRPDEDGATRLAYSIDRSGLPPLPYLELTLLIDVGAVDGIEVRGDGRTQAYDYDAGSGALLVTTAAERLDITLDNARGSATLGAVTIAPLKDNKQWAWSHGFDDNVYLRPAIALFRERDWRATLFLIGKHVEDDRDEEWIADAPYLIELLGDGWSLGNHTWDHTCADESINKATVLRTDERLHAIVGRSSRPDYPLIAFAAPCFRPAYNVVLDELQGSGATQLLINEAGNDYFINVDPGAELTKVDERQIVPFTEDLTIGRSTIIEFGLEAALEQFDWVAAQAAGGSHLWFNTLSHGKKEATFSPLLEHLYDTYGPAGSDELWVAPSDEVYSYLLVRDHATVQHVEVESTVDDGPINEDPITIQSWSTFVPVVYNGQES